MIRTIDDYLNLVTSAHKGKPKFTDVLAALLEPLCTTQIITSSIPHEYDVDFAVGIQLDAIGQWVGRSRNIPIPIQNVYFEFDNEKRGFDVGFWKEAYDTTNTISKLDDDTYRRLLKACIYANSFNGTVEYAQKALDIFFNDPETHLFVIDESYTAFTNNFFAFDDDLRGFDLGAWSDPNDPITTINFVDMRMAVCVSGKRPSILDLAILNNNLINIKPVGVRLNYSITSIDRTPLFGFDVENDEISGFDVGSWGIEPNDEPYVPPYVPPVIAGLTIDNDLITIDSDIYFV